MSTGRLPGEEDSYLASVSDLMVGMLFVFIIMLMAFALNFRTAEQEAAQTRSQLDQARTAAAKERDALKAERDDVTRQRDDLLEQHAALSRVSERLVELQAKRATLLEWLAADLGRREVPVTLDARDG